MMTIDMLQKTMILRYTNKISIKIMTHTRNIKRIHKIQMEVIIIQTINKSYTKKSLIIFQKSKKPKLIITLNNKGMGMSMILVLVNIKMLIGMSVL